MPREQRQRAPGLAFEMQNAVQQIVKERSDRAVDMGALAAGMAVEAD